MSLVVRPVFLPDGHVATLIAHVGTGHSAVIDPRPGSWDLLVMRASELGCRLSLALFTSPAGLDMEDEIPVDVVTPVDSACGVVEVRQAGEPVEVRAAGGRLDLPVAWLRLSLVGIPGDEAQVAYDVPALDAVFAPGELHAAENTMAGGEVSEALLRKTVAGTVWASFAPHGVYQRGVAEELAAREITRARLLDALAADVALRLGGVWGDALVPEARAH